MILHTKTEQEILDCIEAQKKYCEKTEAPHFAPGGRSVLAVRQTHLPVLWARGQWMARA